MAFYGTVVDGQSHWDARGYNGTLTEALLRSGSAFVDSVGWRSSHSGVPVSRFIGTPTVHDQQRQWPRTGAFLYGTELPSDTVPKAIERATYEAAWFEHQNPGQLSASQRTDQRLVREQFGEVSFSYFNTSNPSVGSGMANVGVFVHDVMIELAPYLAGGSNPYGITGVVA